MKSGLGYLEQLESFDRRLLRRVIGVFYPQKISREALYRKTQLQPLRYNLFQARWNLFYRVPTTRRHTHRQHSINGNHRCGEIGSTGIGNGVAHSTTERDPASPD